MILLAFLLPFSLYLLLLGIINRRPHAILVPGTWDFVGILFAASGFLLVGGPAVISSGSESWRMFWLFGTPAGGQFVEAGSSRPWAVLATAYFAVIVGGAAYLLRRRRGLTAIYNIEGEPFEKALAQVFGALGLNPIRSGNLFVFGAGRAFSAPRRPTAAIQAPHSLMKEYDTAAPARELAEAELVGETALLEVDPFALFHHVTLRWEPADSRLRQEVEAELARTLAQSPGRGNPVGDWLVLIALALIGFNLLLTMGLTVSQLLRR